MPPPVVIHIPHASTVIPADVSPAFALTPDELAAELLAMTDAHTDELFALSADVATAVCFPVSRLVVDPERFPDDADEPMAGKGMGVIYTRTSDARTLRREPTRTERAALVARYYAPHHQALTAAVAASLAEHGRCLIVDGHSFPAAPLPYELDPRLDRPDVCIGTDPRHTPVALRDLAVDTYARAGFTVAVDRPFSGALVPMAFYGKDTRVASVMIELNRGLYMDERTGARRADFAKMQGTNVEAVTRIVEGWRSG